MRISFKIIDESTKTESWQGKTENSLSSSFQWKIAWFPEMKNLSESYNQYSQGQMQMYGPEAPSKCKYWG